MRWLCLCSYLSGSTTKAHDHLSRRWMFFSPAHQTHPVTLLGFVFIRPSPWWERRHEGLVDSRVQWEVPGAVEVHGQPVQQFHCGWDQRHSRMFSLCFSSSSSLNNCLLISICALAACLPLFGISRGRCVHSSLGSFDRPWRWSLSLSAAVLRL